MKTEHVFHEIPRAEVKEQSCPKEILAPSRQQKQWLKRCIEQTPKSDCRHQHCAMIVKSGNVLAVRTNRYRNYIFATRPEEVRILSYHAEYRAIMAAGIENCKGATIVVTRVSASGPSLSKPCAACADLIRAVGIKKVIYT